MNEGPQCFVRLHYEGFAGATGNPAGLFDIEATGTASLLSASMGTLCLAMAAAAQVALGDLDFDEPAQAAAGIGLAGAEAEFTITETGFKRKKPTAEA